MPTGTEGLQINVDALAKQLLANMAMNAMIFENTVTPSGHLGREFLRNGLPVVLDKKGTSPPIEWVDQVESVD